MNLKKITDSMKSIILKKWKVFTGISLLILIIAILLAYFYKKEPKDSVKKSIERITDIKKIYFDVISNLKEKPIKVNEFEDNEIESKTEKIKEKAKKESDILKKDKNKINNTPNPGKILNKK